MPAEVEEYLAKMKPDPNFLYLLITALGAADSWGSNVNGDAFFEDALLGTQSPVESLKNFAPYQGVTMPRYKTFIFAKIRKHHQNKEHHPDYGHVELPVWDDKMKRVLLIVAVDRQKAPDIVAKAESGSPIVWSMGCKTKFDSCSICGHKSSKVQDYCGHLKYQMGQILPSGQKVYAVNPMPRFFDISEVLIPADKTAFTLMKIASDIASKKLHVPNYYESVTDCDTMIKVASAGSLVVPSAFAAEYAKIAEELASEKNADITKRFPAGTTDADLSDDTELAKKMKTVNKVSKKEKNIDINTINMLSSMPMHQILSSMAGLGMVAKPHEYEQIVVLKVGSNAPKSDMIPFVCPESIKTAAVEMLLPFVSDRSASSPCIDSRIDGCKSEDDDTALASEPSASYNEYRKSLMGWSPEDTDRTLSKYARVIDTSITSNDIFEEMSGITKQSGWKLPVTGGLAAGSFFAPYLASAHIKLKSAYSGKRPTGVKKLVAEHPMALGAVSGTTSALALAKMLGKLK